MRSPVEEIKERLDIVEVISQYVKLTKAGANFKAPCPFHSEKSGSFFVSPAKQIWHCFGCQKGGDAFSFIKEIEGVEFGDALRILAARAGVELVPQSKEFAQLKSERSRLYEVCELAARFFEKQLSSSKIGLEAFEYLQKRGLPKENIITWRIGYAPDSWRGLSNFLVSSGYNISEIEKAGLSVRGDSGSFDRFRGRIMFPIFDFYSEVVGFGGRIFKKDKNDEAKYVNTPSTILYDKSRILYGLDKAKLSIKKNNSCVVVEGYTDVIMSALSGIDNVVSSSGTALTLGQLKLIKRLTDNLVLGYDMDLAGDTANKRGIDLALSQGFNVSVARPPFEGKDPADVVLQDPAQWVGAVKNAKSIMDYYFENSFAANDAAGAGGKKAIANILLPQIKRIPNAIEQAHWLQKLAQGLGVREEDLREELKKVKLEQSSVLTGNEAVITPVKLNRNQLLEERLLVLVLKYRHLVGSLDDGIISFFSLPGKGIVAAIKESNKTPGQDAAMPDDGPINVLSLKSEIESIAEKDAAQELQFHINEIKKSQVRSELERVSFELNQAEKIKDAKKSQKLHEDFNVLSKSIQKLEENCKK